MGKAVEAGRICPVRHGSEMYMRIQLRAALNMLIKTASIEHGRTHPNPIVVSLHPGTVATRLSRPFQGKIEADGLFTPQRAAAQLTGVVEQLTPVNTGGFFAWDGSETEYWR